MKFAPVLWQLAGTHGPPYWTGETCDALKLLQNSGLLVPVELDGTLTTTDNTEYILIRVGIGGDDGG